MTNMTRNRPLCFSMLLGLFCLCTLPAASLAASPMTDLCDADIMDTIETKAWLEAQREVTQNQNMIAKPDSVLEYTCFDKMMGALANQAGNMLSENKTAWTGGSAAQITSKDMDNAFRDVAGNPLKQYITTNFNHSYLGGRGSIDSSFDNNISGAAYTCNQMDQIWKLAKCANFSTEPEDGFLTFQQLADQEIRRFPEVCAADARWQTNIDAYSSPSWESSYLSNIESSFDKLNEYTKPVSCSASRIIKTGIPVKVQGTVKEDAICINPGCYFDGKNCTHF
ncbi:MAG: hypothetical protein H6855_01945 [Rhodospirillales bacterium]|nr:hypothetical protein [Rhodospirillales bacterium]MCB9964827.1 hypothetical protein [Rhodospirillales bacterium]